MSTTTRTDDAPTGPWLPAGHRRSDVTGSDGRTAIDLADLADRAGVKALLRRFYGRALIDDVLAEPFSELREAGLESHLEVMCDFWETVLFRAGLYHGSALTVHRRLDAQHRLDARHFARWLELWTATVDEMYRGPIADRAKLQAGRIATAMHRRLRGVGASDFGAEFGYRAESAQRPRGKARL